MILSMTKYVSKRWLEYWGHILTWTLSSIYAIAYIEDLITPNFWSFPEIFILTNQIVTSIQIALGFCRLRYKHCISVETRYMIMIGRNHDAICNTKFIQSSLEHDQYNGELSDPLCIFLPLVRLLLWDPWDYRWSCRVFIGLIV